MSTIRNYGIFFSGNASTPTNVGLIDWNSNEIICQIWISKEKGDEIRAQYNKYVSLLKTRFKSIL